MLASEILRYYTDGNEEERLLRSAGRLERVRTQEILSRYLPRPPRRVLDAGGGTAVYALPLARDGYEVHLVDAVPFHVERANLLSNASDIPLASATVGDVRTLDAGDESFDAVLMFGPLYHLTDPADRL